MTINQSSGMYNSVLVLFAFAFYQFINTQNDRTFCGRHDTVKMCVRCMQSRKSTIITPSPPVPQKRKESNHCNGWIAFTISCNQTKIQVLYFKSVHKWKLCLKATFGYTSSFLIRLSFELDNFRANLYWNIHFGTVLIKKMSWIKNSSIFSSVIFLWYHFFFSFFMRKIQSLLYSKRWNWNRIWRKLYMKINIIN